MSETVYQNMPDHEIIRAILAEYPFVSESHETAPGVYTHTVTPPALTVEDITAFVNSVRPYASDPETIFVSRATMHGIRKAASQGKRDHRVQLRKRRQRRAAQRRHERGGR